MLVFPQAVTEEAVERTRGRALSFLISISKKCTQTPPPHSRNTTAPHASPTFTATTSVIDIHRVNMHSRILHCQRPTATASSPSMASLLAVHEHQLYVSRRILSDQAQLLVSTKVNDVDSLISSMTDSITTENKSILVKRILTLSSYGDSSNAGPLGSINEMYLNHLVNLDFFDQISAEDQAGLLMEECTVGVKDRNSFLRLTGYLRDQGAVGMITNLQSGMTLFLKPSGHCRAQMYSLSTQDFKTWSLVTARRIAVESKAARISAEAHADARIDAEVEATRFAADVEATRIAAMIAAEVEAARIAAEVEAAMIAARIAAMIARHDVKIVADVEAARISTAESASAHRPVEQSSECKQAERERYKFLMRMILIHNIWYLGKTADESPPPQALPTRVAKLLGNVLRFYAANYPP